MHLDMSVCLSVRAPKSNIIAPIDYICFYTRRSIVTVATCLIALDIIIFYILLH